MDKGQGDEHLDRTIGYYGRGYFLRNDWYNGINLAYLLNVHTTTALDATNEERIADLIVLEIAMLSPGSIVTALALFITALSILCLMTGNTPRSYVVNARYDQAVVAGSTITMEQLATSFQPQLFQQASSFSPPALIMWWEAINTADCIALIYHPVGKMSDIQCLLSTGFIISTAL